MPHTRSAKKNVRKAEKRRIANKVAKKAIKKQIKTFLAAEEGSIDELRKQYNLTAKRLDKAAAKKFIHPNLAARKKAQFARTLRDAEGTAVPPRLRKARELTSRAGGLFLRGQLERAETKYLAAVHALSTLQNEYPIDLAVAKVNHAIHVADIGHFSEAAAELRECLHLCNDAPSTQCDDLTAFARKALNDVLRIDGRCEEGNPTPPKHVDPVSNGDLPQPWDTAFQMLSLPVRGLLLTNLKKYEKAEAVYRELGTKQVKRAAPPDQVLPSLSNLGFVLYKQGHLGDAEEVMRQALNLSGQFRLDELPLSRRRPVLVTTAQVHERLFVCLMKLGRIEEASVIDELGRNRRFQDLLALHASGTAKAGSSRVTQRDSLGKFPAYRETQTLQGSNLAK